MLASIHLWIAKVCDRKPFPLRRLERRLSPTPWKERSKALATFSATVSKIRIMSGDYGTFCQTLCYPLILKPAKLTWEQPKYLAVVVQCSHCHFIITAMYNWICDLTVLTLVLFQSDLTSLQFIKIFLNFSRKAFYDELVIVLTQFKLETKKASSKSQFCV